ncbi:uncharacterized protein LOC110446279 [Mizuhopecten yessoensis]|uniref:ATP-dependent helicase IRC20 n=1 Tax=Mizuhopecten yessoensis TaxID=6573 RepID=A0A210QXS1_MIZYE|nr:uncharacterized protein LOC110446279 [Mizuhopecten yessoensis]OWF53502.1 ATP-dependent helicase IRC20 [Mizuhopecten yessoensis]
MVNCSICLDAIKTPTCCIPCGHVFCNMCIGRWQRQHAYNGTTRDCPQCRCQIEQAQIIRFDTSEEVNDIEYDDAVDNPWDVSDVGTILKSLENIWKRSQVRQILKTGQARILSYDCVKCMWDCARNGWNNGKQFVGEIQEADGLENKLNLVKMRLHQGFSHCKHRVMHHPLTEALKRKWAGLSEDWKHVLAISLAVLVVLLLVDVQHKDGLIQSVIFPVFHTFFFIFHELLACLVYIVVRPLYCSFLCTMEVASTLADVTVETLVSVIQMIMAFIVLPMTMALGLIQVVTATVGTIMRTLIPLFILLYFISPSVQHHCRAVLARLQHQNHNQEQGN